MIEATLTAAGVGVGFLLVGDLLLGLLGVTVADFQIAGGILLLVLSIYDLLHPATPVRQLGTNMSVVPLGIAMIVRPAALTNLLLLARIQGYGITLVAFSANLPLVSTALQRAHKIERAIAEAGARAVARLQPCC